jgi:hypothetical protein
MTDKISEKYDGSVYPLSDMYENINESNYVPYTQIACVQYNYIIQHKYFHGFHLVNWRVNFANLTDFLLEKSINDNSVSKFLELYESSASTLYEKLGLEY